MNLDGFRSVYSKLAILLLNTLLALILFNIFAAVFFSFVATPPKETAPFGILFREYSGFLERAYPARISHQPAAATADASALTALCFVGLLDVLHEYDLRGPRSQRLVRTAPPSSRYASW